MYVSFITPRQQLERGVVTFSKAENDKPLVAGEATLTRY